MDLKNLAGYTNVIFSDVYGEKITNIELVQSPEPKEITSKGGLFCDNFLDVETIKTVLVGDEGKTIIKQTDPLKQNFTYKDIDNNTVCESVKKEVSQFISKFFGWHAQFNYYNKFGATPSNFELIKSKMQEDLLNYLKAGINDKLTEVQDNNNINIEEPLFFYPLVGIMNNVIKNIESLKTVKA
jgi:hypothetical protein